MKVYQESAIVLGNIYNDVESVNPLEIAVRCTALLTYNCSSKVILLDQP